MIVKGHLKRDLPEHLDIIPQNGKDAATLTFLPLTIDKYNAVIKFKDHQERDSIRHT